MPSFGEVEHATAGIRSVSRSNGGAAACSTCAAANWPSGEDASDRDFDAWVLCVFGSYSQAVLSGAARTRLFRGAEPCHRAPRSGVEVGSAPRVSGRVGQAEG